MSQQIEISTNVPTVLDSVQGPFLATASLQTLKNAIIDFIKSRDDKASIREINLRFAHRNSFRKALRTLKEDGIIVKSKTLGENCLIVPCYSIGRQRFHMTW